VLASTKSNLAKPPPSLSFSLVTVGDVARVEWHGESKHQASGLVAQTLDHEERTTVDEAADLLRGLLERAGGEIEAKTAVRELAQAGYRDKTAQRARQRVGAVAKRKKFSGAYVWTMPDSAPVPCPPVQHGNPVQHGASMPDNMPDTLHAGQHTQSNMSDDGDSSSSSHAGQPDAEYARASDGELEDLASEIGWTK
jgi:hypothetical protein